MKCKEKEDLIEIRVIIVVIIILIIIIIIIILIISIIIIITTMTSACKTRTAFSGSESTCLRPRATSSQTNSFKARSA